MTAKTAQVVSEVVDPTTDFRGYKPGAKLLARTVDDKAKIHVHELVVVKILGDHLIVRPADDEKAPTMTFSRKAATLSGNTGFAYIPDSIGKLLHPTDENKKLLADYKSGTLKPLLSEGELAKRKAIEWLRRADYADIVKVVDIEKLARAAHAAGAL